MGKDHDEYHTALVETASTVASGHSQDLIGVRYTDTGNAEDSKPSPTLPTKNGVKTAADAQVQTGATARPPAVKMQDVGPQFCHGRKISWGANDYVSWDPGSVALLPTAAQNAEDAAPADHFLLPPASADSHPVAGKSASATTDSADHMARAQDSESKDIPRPIMFNLRSRSDSRSSRLDVCDILQRSPLESEAETYIVKLLEGREDSMRPRSESIGNTSNLTEIADESMKAFDASAGSTRQDRRDSLRSSGNNNTGDQRTLHRRNVTMEQKLFDLTAAIGAMKTDHDHQNANTAVGEPEAQPISSADAFGKNTSLLFRRRRKKSDTETADDPNPPTNTVDDGSLMLSEDAEEEPSQNGSKGSSHWRYLRDAVHAGMLNHGNKKTDEEVDHDNGVDIALDVEIGVGQSQLSHTTDGIGSNPTGGEGEPSKSSAFAAAAAKHERGLYKDFQDFFEPQSSSFYRYCKCVFVYTLAPAIGVAALLFYVAGNPPTGILDSNGRATNDTLVNTNKGVVETDVASASWWILFACRQVVTGSLAKLTEVFLIDFLSIQMRTTMRVLGPWPTLLLLQSKGWPFILFFWGCFDFALLAGTRPFFSHWGYWQDQVDLFNASNPSGNIVASDWNYRILASAVSVGAIVSLKRLWLGLYLGRRTFALYSDKLAAVMNKILLVSQAASLGREFERIVKNRGKFSSQLGLHRDNLNELIDTANDDGSVGGLTSTASERSAGVGQTGRIIDTDDTHPLTGGLSSVQRSKLTRLLGAWEEPSIAEMTMEPISVNGILQFRRALACLHTQFPFSGSFGLADSREHCVESAQDTYNRLLLRTPDANVLSFDVLALLGVERDGSLNERKLKELIRLFRPDRDGSLSVLDFVKSLDAVYKEIRMLRASVSNSSKIDLAFESIFNVAFYLVLFTVILSSIGFDPLALFLSVSGVVLAFAFMIGSASSKYFEGLLFILVRRPYQIGDSIHVSNVEADTSYTGSAWWTVEDVNLFSTSVIFMFTNERASLSNGSLANSRIINSSNSPPAWIYIILRFPVDVAYEKLQIFNKSLEEFFRARPREWLHFDAFRAIRVAADEGFIEYVVVSQHRVTFAEWGALHLSKADLMHFCLELSKKLDIKYRSPPLPVELSVISGAGISNTPNLTELPVGREREDNAPVYSPDLTGLQAMFVPRGSRKLD